VTFSNPTPKARGADSSESETDESDTDDHIADDASSSYKRVWYEGA